MTSNPYYSAPPKPPVLSRQVSSPRSSTKLYRIPINGISCHNKTSILRLALHSPMPVKLIAENRTHLETPCPPEDHGRYLPVPFACRSASPLNEKRQYSPNVVRKRNFRRRLALSPDPRFFEDYDIYDKPKSEDNFVQETPLCLSPSSDVDDENTKPKNNPSSEDQLKKTVMFCIYDLFDYLTFYLVSG